MFKSSISIYNDFMVPDNQKFLQLEVRFRTFVDSLFLEADRENLNLREVSHEFGSIIHVIESEFVLRRATKLYDKIKV